MNTSEKAKFSSSASQMGLEVPWTEPKQRSRWLQAPRRRRRSSNRVVVVEEEGGDPYESDPGESYRDHCEQQQQQEEGTKSCLSMPKFLRKSRNQSPTSVLMMETTDDEYVSPQSLPKDLSRLCYSLRSEVGDGSKGEPQQGQQEQERALRPNRVHINVSHWSDFGKRDYMEDR